MKDIFQEVQNSFMELGVVLNGVDLENGLEHKTINEIYAALIMAYKSFEDGLCKTAYTYENCHTHREQLHALIEMIKPCVKNGKIDWATNVALVEFVYVIPQILAEIGTEQIESFQKG